MGSRSRAIATASEESAAAAAMALLAQGNAVDAVVAGVFAAAAASPGVLLGPVQLLFGGAGLGLRAVDGRTRQPGKGAPRPRGFKTGDEIAPAAHVGVPVLPAALAAALASSGVATLAQVLAPAIALAKGPRKELLKRLAQRGALAMLDDRFTGELVAACGRVAGGLVTRDDIDAARPAIAGARETLVGARMVARVPWDATSAALQRRGLHQTDARESVPANDIQIVAACDRRGLVAVACYVRAQEGVTVEALELLAPFTASPVLRGETRVQPGEPTLSSAPIALARPEADGPYDLAVGIAGDPLGASALEAALKTWPAVDALDARPPYEGAGTLVGVTRTEGGAIILGRR